MMITMTMVTIMTTEMMTIDGPTATASCQFCLGCLDCQFYEMMTIDGPTSTARQIMVVMIGLLRSLRLSEFESTLRGNIDSVDSNNERLM